MKSNIEKEAGALILRHYGSFFKKQYQAFEEYEISSVSKSFTPIIVTMDPLEHLLTTDLVSSDNTLMTKVLSVLTSLCLEVMTLKGEAFQKHFRFLSIYDEFNESNINSQMESICLLASFVNRSDDTLKNLCSQIFGIYTEEIVNLNGIQLHYIINHVGEMFTILVILEILILNTSLVNNWNKYYNTFKSLENSFEKIDLKEKEYKSFMLALENISIKLMKDDIVQSTLHNVLTSRQTLANKNMTLVSSEFSSYLKQAIANLDKIVQEKPNVKTMYKCIKVNALFVLNIHLFGNNDKKIFKSLMELNSKAHSIHIIGTALWFPEQFLQKYVPALCIGLGKISQTQLKARQAYITYKKSSLTRDVLYLQSACTQWILNVEDMFSCKDHELCAAEMTLHAKTLLDGIDIASQTKFAVLTLLNLHLALGIPFPKSMLQSLYDIIDTLKSMKNVITRNRNQILNSINMISQHLVFQATSLILDVKKFMMTDKAYAINKLDELTCIVIAERALKGAGTLQRNVAANVALSFIPETAYTEESYAKLGNLLEKIQAISNFFESMDLYCNCSWMLWHQNVFSMYFDQNFGTQLNVFKLKYFLMVMDDCILLLKQMNTFFNENKSSEFLVKTERLVNDCLLQYASQHIETNLRLHIHSHLQLDIINPFTSDLTKKLLLVIDDFRIQNIYLSVIPTVEHYLSTTYYNLTTVVLSDWKTYGEMRQMAKFKFNLKTVEDNLPTQTLEQGLDVLEIMRNIHIFVSKYNYNLNNQIFIEKSSNNKYLNSINIRHVANSIRTHGTGIMNTTVNFSYQFLKKKFFTFSQFMYDEHIKSRLIKDLRNFKDTYSLNGGLYPYKSADKFNKGIKVLGLADDGQSYLDLFRNLISQIGNAIGYVRMVRSGGRHCCSEATVFLPSLEDVQSFKELCDDAVLDVKTVQSAQILDNNINALLTNFIQGTEYFKLLVDVFSPVFRNPKNIHLKNFYVIVPPLTLNFVDHMILSKDKMTKKNKSGASFTDDGFAMGVAYILKLLDQDTDFETLHWFESVWKYIEEERQNVEEQKLKGSVQLQQALALTEKKLKTFEEEYRLLYYSLTSARIFFR